MARSQVTRISQKELSAAVEKAVSLASRKHKLELEHNLFDRDVFRLPWWIVGRMLRDNVDLDQAYKAAESITTGLRIPEVDLQAVAVKIDKDILVGFIERFNGQLDIGDFRPGDLG